MITLSAFYLLRYTIYMNMIRDGMKFIPAAIVENYPSSASLQRLFLPP